MSGIMEKLRSMVGIHERQLLIVFSGKVRNEATRRDGIVSRLTTTFHIFLEQVLLLWDEVAVAVPTRLGNWAIVSLRDRQIHREIPKLGEHVVRTLHGSTRHQAIMSEIYKYDGFVEVDTDDIVVDVGAHVGSFTMAVADSADRVVAIDPTASVNPYLERNTAGMDNVEVVGMAAWNCSEEIDIKTSEEANENSILTPDTGETGSSFAVRADTLDSILSDLEVESVDFLKLEAEGVEVEILRKALEDSIKIDKIAVDVTPERDGESPDAEVRALLEGNGFTVRRKDSARFWGDSILFGKNC